MGAVMEERRTTQNPYDIAGALACLYTLGYLVMVGLLYFIEIPAGNKDPLLQLFGLMSAIQMALISFYYGSSKIGEATQRAIEQRQGRSEAVVQDIVKAVTPVVAAAATTPAVTPAPINPATGVIPAVEVVSQSKGTP